MKILFVTIATGKYWKYFEILYPQILSQESYSKEFKVEILVFKDKSQKISASVLENSRIKVADTEFLNWPFVTLMRYHEIFRKCADSDCDVIVWIDCDMKLIGQIPFESMQDGVVFSRHPGFTFNLIGFLKLSFKEKEKYIKERIIELGKGQKFPGTWEENAKSMAFLERRRRMRYVHGAFWGGEKQAVLEMCQTLSISIDTDLGKNVIAVWHDESFLNWYCSVKGGKFFEKNFSSVENFWTTNPKKATVLSLDKNKLDLEIKNRKEDDF
jgi:hypothetical protein